MNRRDFIKQSSAALAAVAMASSVVEELLSPKPQAPISSVSVIWGQDVEVKNLSLRVRNIFEHLNLSTCTLSGASPEISRMLRTATWVTLYDSTGRITVSLPAQNVTVMY